MSSILLLALTASLVSCEQDSVSGVVTVRYELDEPAVVTVDFQTKSAEGAWTSIGAENFTTLAGDVNRYVKPPTDGAEGLWLRWAAANDWPDHAFGATDFRAVLTAWPTNDPPRYMAVDLGAKLGSTREHTPVRYYVSSNAVPGGVLDNRYRRSFLLMRKIECAGKVFRRGCNFTETAYGNTRIAPTLAKLTKNFYMSVYPLTGGYGRMTGNSYGVLDPSTSLDPELKPRMGDAMYYNLLRGDGCDWPKDGDAVGGFMATLRNLVDGKILFDLPLEAQYEFAAQGGFDTSLGTGKRFNENCGETNMVYETCWLTENKDDGSDPEFPAGGNVRHPHSVGLKLPNGYGLYDMQGNGRSRCRDWWVEDLSTVTDDLDADGVHVDPIGPTSNASGYRSGHGSSWDAPVGNRDWQTWSRFPLSTNGDYNYTGARVVCPALAPDL